MDFGKIFERFESALAKEGYKIEIENKDRWESDKRASYVFSTKQTRGWCFGLWLEAESENSYPMVEFFAMYEDNIDKFKPSRAENCFKFEWLWDDDLWIKCALGIIRMIKYHPIISYNMDCYRSQLDYRAPHTLMYIHFKSKALKHKLKSWYLYHSKINLDIIRLRAAKRKLMRLGLYEKIHITDNNVSDEEMRCICSPRYEMNIHYTKAGYESTTENSEGEMPIKEWIYSQYRWNGKPLENCHVFGYLDGKECGWYYDRPQPEYFKEVYGWKYKLYCLLKGGHNE